jgi:voltage-gated potassium channel
VRIDLRDRAADRTGLMTGPRKHVRRLHLRDRLSPEQTLLFRGAIVLALLALVLIVFWIDRENLHDNLDGEISVTDLFYFTMVTITTVGYGDIVPTGTPARLIDAFLVTPVRVIVWFIFLGTAYQFVVQRILEDLRMKRVQQHLSDHVVLCGYGHAGQVAAQEMVDQGTKPEKLVVVDIDEAHVLKAAAAGFIGVHGDCTQESLLRDLRLHKAYSAVICLPRDDTAMLCLLTLRYLAKDLKVIAMVREEENAKLVRRAGAHLVVAPSRVSGQLVADGVHGRFLAPFLMDLIGTRGRFRLIEFLADASLVGKKMNACSGRLVIGLERKGHIIGFWEHPDELIQLGDLLLAIQRNPSAGEQPGAVPT